MAKQRLLSPILVYFGLFVGVEATGCVNSPMDIVFVLDSSDGAPQSLFDQEKQLTQQVINDLWDSRNRFGLVTFGSDPFSQFYMNTYSDVTEVQMAVQYLWLSTGRADVAKALEYALLHDFDSAKGGRIVAPDVVILITASDIRNEPLVHTLSGNLQKSETELFVILVGSHLSQYWYEKLTPSDKILRAQNVQNLILIRRNMTSNLCQGRGILRQWLQWSACGAPCGLGYRRRFRTCEKRNPDDKDCEGKLTEAEECLSKPCSEPVDGMWSSWDDWSSCSKTCQYGVRTRHRTCSAPSPENGGKHCSGENIQRQNCSVWSCPDCKKQCPPGSSLTADCSMCICSNVVLYGMVRTTAGRPVLNAEIFLSSKLYASIGKTEYTGYFHLDGICIVNEEITVKKDSYSTAQLSPSQVNSSHWFINATLVEYVAPIFVMHPEDKIRLVGQSMAMCCGAVGAPSPSEYTWYKNNELLLGKGSNGTLWMKSLQMTDEGHYCCEVETPAGASRSNIGHLIVKDAVVDTCSSPVSLSEELPVGCYVKGDQSKNSTIDVGTCGKQSCVSREMLDNGTCVDWWPSHCCDTGDRELVEVECDGFSFQKSRVTSCKCQMCFEETLVTGTASSRLENGSTIPLRLGVISVNGKTVARTNMAGVFSFTVPKKLKRLVVDFRDEVFKELLDSTKIVIVTPGTSTSIKIALSQRPKPINFNSSSDLDVEVGNSGNRVPVGKMSVEKHSLVTVNGEPFNGTAKAHVHFMDPRNLNDFEAANGEFSVDDDGVSCPLETFGIFRTQFESNSGEPLIPNKPLKFEMDPSVFNVTSNKYGRPNVELWSMDVNTGKWVANGRTEYKLPTGRKRSTKNSTVISTATLVNVEKLDLYETVSVLRPEAYTVTVSTVERYKNYYRPGVFNWDTRLVNRQETRYRLQPQATTVVKQNACFVSVVVYKTLSRNERETGGTQVKAVTWDVKTNKYAGVDQKPTNEHGHVCLSILCDSIVYLTGEHKTDTTPLHALPKHDIPLGYNAVNQINGTQVKFDSYNWEYVVDSVTNKRRYSPVYYFSDLIACQNSYNSDNYKFEFALSLTAETKRDLTVSENVYDNKLSWYPTPPNSLSRKICFMKIGIKVKDNYDIRFIGNSYQTTKTGGLYGTYDVGPLTDPTFSNLDERAACMEFRCPGIVNNKGTVFTDVDTFLDVYINPYPAVACRLSTPGLNVTQITSGKGFQVLVKTGRNYGPAYGVYIATKGRAIVQRYCYQGVDTGTVASGMVPKKGLAVHYDCT